MTAREAGRAYAERLWKKCSADERACEWRIIGRRDAVTRAEWDAAREHWTKLQAAERGEEGMRDADRVRT